jgi:hypothetical protein
MVQLIHIRELEGKFPIFEHNPLTNRTTRVIVVLPHLVSKTKKLCAH